MRAITVDCNCKCICDLPLCNCCGLENQDLLAAYKISCTTEKAVTKDIFEQAITITGRWL